jgi:hypothetical protein
MNIDDSVAQNSDKIDANQLVSISLLASFTDTDADGSVKFQFSNDPCLAGNLPATFTPTNWVDVANASATVTAGAAVGIVVPQICYRWLRVVWTPTTPGTGDIVVRINALGI